MASEKYALKTLTKVLVDNVKFFSGPDTCILLKQLETCKINSKELQAEIAKKCEIQTRMIIESSEFLNLNANTLSRLLSYPTLNVKEIDLFNAVIKWATNQCLVQDLVVNSVNLRIVLSRLIYLQRYRSMSLKEFANGPGKLKLLNDSESVDLFLDLSLNEKRSIELPKPLIQAERLRPPVYNVLIINQNVDHFVKNATERRSEWFKFRVDDVIYLKGINLKGSNYVGGLKALKGELSISKKNSNVVSLVSVNADDCNQNSDEEDEWDRTLVLNHSLIEFHYPILIEPNFDYIVSLRYSERGRYSFKSCHSKAFSANVQFDIQSDHGLCFMTNLVFNKV